METWLTILGTAGLLLVGGTVLAQEPVPLGDQFPINSYTTGRQALPAVAMDAQGNFVVAWDGPDVNGRRFSADAIFIDGFESGNTSAWSSATD